MSVLPAAIVMLAKKLKSNGMLIFLVILCLIFLSASQIILQMIDIMNAKFIDRGSTFRSNIPLRGIQFIVILYVLLILFKNNGKYVFKIDEDLNDYKNIIGTAFMIYLQLIKEQQHISI